ncbi:MAG: hypothetical protein JXR94_04550 [Candidatus Hydrogenedentes bacterium]|nr:hypothetical protein [Candidatus Hydrogenedentota bacterium]
MATAKNAMQKLLDLAGRFVTAHQAAWNHADWEEFVGQALALGFKDDDETRRNLGNALEASKFLYQRMPARPPAKRAARK